MRKILPVLFTLVLSTIGFGQIANNSILHNKKLIANVLKADPNFRATGYSQQHRGIDGFTELTYFNEEGNTSFIGLGEGVPITTNTMIYLPSSTMAEHTGEILTKMSFLIRNSGDGSVNSLKLRIWTDTTDINNPTYEQEVGNIVDGWNEVELTTPYTLGTEPLFLGYFVSGTGFVLGTEEGVGSVEPNGYGDIIELNGIFSHLSQFGIGDLAIKASVGKLDSLGIKLKSIDVVDNITPEVIDVVGTVKNVGIDTIKSYDVTYVLNGDTSSVYSVTGVNIASGATHQFTHDKKANLTQAGNYELKVIVSNVNGSDKEADLSDNVLSKNITSILEVVQKKVLHELFTSSTCGPCAKFNPVIDEVIFNSSNSEKAVLIKYQVNWPGGGDPYYVAEAGEKVKYYGVEAVPSFVVDGNTESPDYKQEVLDIYASVLATLKIDNGVINYDFETKKLTADIDVTALANVSGNLVAQMAVVEKKTTGNIRSNGETEFHNVMMKFIDNTNGNRLSNFVAGDTQHVSATTSLANTNIEEISDIRVVVWVQDYDTKEVFQSEYIDLTQEDMIDLEFTNISTVSSACGLPSDSEVKVTVANRSAVPVSNFKVKCSVNEGEVKESTFTETLAPGQETEIVFNQDFSKIGAYNIVVTSELDGDVVLSNNKVETVVHNVKSVDATGYAEDFQVLPVGWSIEDANQDNVSWLYLNYPIEGTDFGHGDVSAYLYQYNTDAITSGDDYLYSTCIDFEANKTYELSFWYRVMDGQYPEKLNVFIGDAPNKEAMTQQIIDLGTFSNTNYENSEAKFQVPADGTYYIGFHANSDPDKFILLVDDVKISDATAVNEIVDEVNIYPNPTNGLFRVEGVQGAKVAVYNIVGEVVYRNSNASENINIDLSSQKAGSYLVKITNDDKVSTHKIVVTK